MHGRFREKLGIQIPENRSNFWLKIPECSTIFDKCLERRHQICPRTTLVCVDSDSLLLIGSTLILLVCSSAVTLWLQRFFFFVLRIFDPSFAGFLIATFNVIVIVIYQRAYSRITRSLLGSARISPSVIRFLEIFKKISGNMVLMCVISAASAIFHTVCLLEGRRQLTETSVSELGMWTFARG